MTMTRRKQTTGKTMFGLTRLKPTGRRSLAQGAIVQWVTGIDSASSQAGFRVWGAPCILASTRSSCLYSTCECLMKHFPCWHLRSISPACRWAFIWRWQTLSMQLNARSKRYSEFCRRTFLALIATARAANCIESFAPGTRQQLATFTRRTSRAVIHRISGVFNQHHATASRATCTVAIVIATLRLPRN